MLCEDTHFWSQESSQLHGPMVPGAVQRRSSSKCLDARAFQGWHGMTSISIFQNLSQLYHNYPKKHYFLLGKYLQNRRPIMNGLFLSCLHSQEPCVPRAQLRARAAGRRGRLHQNPFATLKVTTEHNWENVMIPRNIQDQVGQGSEPPDLVSGVPARWGGLD